MYSVHKIEECKMSECSLTKGCIFFNDKMEAKPGLTSMYKNKYCKGNYEDCARYMVATTIGRGEVPSNMFPNMKEKAEEIISNNRKN